MGDTADAVTAGIGLTVITTVLELVHPSASVTVRVYVVVADGLAVGLAITVEVKAVAGDHE